MLNPFNQLYELQLTRLWNHSLSIDAVLSGLL